MAGKIDASSQLPSSSSHRLPTVSASQALQQLRSKPAKIVSSGLPRLDALLAKGPKATTAGIDFGANGSAGFSPGHVADIYGPPGSGKTAFCLQAATSALGNGHAVVWIDCGQPIPIHRLKHLLQVSAPYQRDPEKVKQSAARFQHYTAADLAHLLTILIQPAPELTDEATALVVIDSVSILFEAAYSRTYDRQSKKQSDAAKWASARKYAVMGDLISRLQKLATMNSLVVLLTQQTRMRVRSGAGALLLPALSCLEWDNRISTQLVLFRDFPPKTMSQSDTGLQERWSRLRYVGVIKVNGVSAEENGRFDTVVPFTIETTGLCELPPLQADAIIPVLASPVRTHKRRFEEIADSEEERLGSDDDYGFDEDLDFESGLAEVTEAS